MPRPTILILDFPYPGAWGDELTSTYGDLATSINDEPGLLWKLWLEDRPTGRSGGVHAFATREEALGYLAKHRARLEGLGITDVGAKVFEANVALSVKNHVRF